MRGHRFKMPESIIKAYKLYVSTTQLSEWHNCFECRYIQMKSAFMMNAGDLKINGTIYFNTKLFNISHSRHI